VGKLGVFSSATATSPIVVARVKGIAYHEIPPRIYPGTAEAGSAAIPCSQLACQNDISAKRKSTKNLLMEGII
jgi:hypothetical protein